MKTFWLFVCSFVCLLSVNGQSPSHAQLVGTWIGVHAEWDLDVFCPLPTYLRLDADGVYALGMVDGTATAVHSTWAVQHDSVRLDTIHYAPGLVRLQNDLLRVGMYYPMVFRRFTDVPLDSASVYQQLAGRIWQSDSLTVSLFTDGRVTLKKPDSGQQTAHYWRLAPFNQSIFLIIYGNQYGRDGGYKPLWQIVQASAGQVRAVGWNGRAVATSEFRFVRSMTSADSCRSVSFQPCSNCFARMWYDTPVGRTQQRYDLWQQVRKYYSSVSLAGQSGLVRIRFVINCVGERGQFEVAGFDDAYCPRPFSARITDQLIRICRDHIPASTSARISDLRDSQQEDSVIALTFRLKDGQLTDLLP